MSLAKDWSGVSSKGEPTSWDSPVRICTRQHAHTVTALTECHCLRREGINQKWCLQNIRLPPKPLNPTAYSRCARRIATPLLVAPIQSKYSSDARFHHQHWLNNQNPSLLDEGWHQAPSPKALRGPVLHFHTHPTPRSPCELLLPQSITWLVALIFLKTLSCSLANWELRHLCCTCRPGTVASICFPPTSNTDTLLLDKESPPFQQAGFCLCSLLPLRKETLSLPSLWFSLLLSYPKQLSSWNPRHDQTIPKG